MNEPMAVVAGHDAVGVCDTFTSIHLLYRFLVPGGGPMGLVSFYILTLLSASIPFAHVRSESLLGIRFCPSCRPPITPKSHLVLAARPSQPHTSRPVSVNTVGFHIYPMYQPIPPIPPFFYCRPSFPLRGKRSLDVQSLESRKYP